MKGSPLCAALLLSFIFALAIVPLLSLTHREPQSFAASEASGNETLIPVLSGFVTVRSAHPYQSIEISRGGKVLWQVSEPGLEAESELELLAQDLLQFRVIWPDETPETAVFVEIEPDGKEAFSQTYWAVGNLGEEIRLDLK